MNVVLGIRPNFGGKKMTKFFTSTEAAKAIGTTRDNLLYALRHGAPEPKRRLGGRRVFSTADIEDLRRWFDKHRGTAATA